MAKARKCGVNVPYIMNVDLENKSIIMSHVEGMKLKDYLNQEQHINLNDILYDVGKNIALLHNDSVIHGDLTTSNIMVKEDVNSKTKLIMVHFL